MFSWAVLINSYGDDVRLPGVDLFDVTVRSSELYTSMATVYHMLVGWKIH